MRASFFTALYYLYHPHFQSLRSKEKSIMVRWLAIMSRRRYIMSFRFGHLNNPCELVPAHEPSHYKEQFFAMYADSGEATREMRAYLSQKISGAQRNTKTSKNTITK